MACAERLPQGDGVTDDNKPVKQFEDVTEGNELVKQFDDVTGDNQPVNQFEDVTGDNEPAKQFDDVTGDNEPVKQFDDVTDDNEPVKQLDDVTDDVNEPVRQFDADIADMLQCVTCRCLLHEAATFDSCLHSCCKPCSDVIIKGMKDDLYYMGIECPKCHRLSRYFIYDLKMLNDLVSYCKDKEGLDKLDFTPVKAAPCPTFGKQKKKRNGKKKGKALKASERSASDGVASEGNRCTSGLYDQQAFCDSHPDEFVGFACVSCDFKPLCAECLQDGHQYEDHSIVLAEKAIILQLYEIQAHVQSIESKCNRIENEVKKLRKMKERVIQIYIEIRETLQSEIRLIMKRLLAQEKYIANDCMHMDNKHIYDVRYLPGGETKEFQPFKIACKICRKIDILCKNLKLLRNTMIYETARYQLLIQYKYQLVQERLLNKVCRARQLVRYWTTMRRFNVHPGVMLQHLNQLGVVLKQKLKEQNEDLVVDQLHIHMINYKHLHTPELHLKHFQPVIKHLPEETNICEIDTDGMHWEDHTSFFFSDVSSLNGKTMTKVKECELDGSCISKLNWLINVFLFNHKGTNGTVPVLCDTHWNIMLHPTFKEKLYMLKRTKNSNIIAIGETGLLLLHPVTYVIQRTLAAGSFDDIFIHTHDRCFTVVQNNQPQVLQFAYSSTKSNAVKAHWNVSFGFELPEEHFSKTSMRTVQMTITVNTEGQVLIRKLSCQFYLFSSTGSLLTVLRFDWIPSLMLIDSSNRCLMGCVMASSDDDSDQSNADCDLKLMTVRDIRRVSDRAGLRTAVERTLGTPAEHISSCILDAFIDPKGSIWTIETDSFDPGKTLAEYAVY